MDETEVGVLCSPRETLGRNGPNDVVRGTMTETGLRTWIILYSV